MLFLASPPPPHLSTAASLPSPSLPSAIPLPQATLWEQCQAQLQKEQIALEEAVNTIVASHYLCVLLLSFPRGKRGGSWRQSSRGWSSGNGCHGYHYCVCQCISCYDSRVQKRQYKAQLRRKSQQIQESLVRVVYTCVCMQRYGVLMWYVCVVHMCVYMYVSVQCVSKTM